MVNGLGEPRAEQGTQFSVYKETEGELDRNDEFGVLHGN
jgi:hypothetical protein